MSGLDLTDFVSPYFKAIEVFLVKSIGLLSEGKISTGPKYEVKIGSYDFYTKSTIRNYTFSSNLSLLPYEKMDFLKGQIDRYVTESRNGLAHKNTLEDIGKTKDIKDKSWQLLIDLIQNLQY